MASPGSFQFKMTERFVSMNILSFCKKIELKNGTKKANNLNHWSFA